MKSYLVVLLLAGCASQAAREPDSFNAASREPACARKCLDSNSACLTGGMASQSRLATNDIIRACNANARQCLSTCPAR